MSLDIGNLELMGSEFGKMMKQFWNDAWIRLGIIVGGGILLWKGLDKLDLTGTGGRIKNFFQENDLVDVMQEVAGYIQLVPSLITPIVKKVAPDVDVSNLAEGADWIADMIQSLSAVAGTARKLMKGR